jgi:hypothetical protein
MSRAAQFAAGAASLASVAACSSSARSPDAATDTMTMTADGGGDSQNSDSPKDSRSEATDAQPTDAPRDFGPAIPIYSAVFPPSKTRIASTPPAPAHQGRPPHRASRR